MSRPSASPNGPIGRRLLRVEDRPLLTGGAVFVDDLELDGMLYARFARSLQAHARIASLTLAAARAAPGVAGAFGAAELGLGPLVPPNENPDAVTIPRPLLAQDVVRFAGEPLAVVVADSPYRAEDAAELVDAMLEPLPVLGDAIDALHGAPLHGHDGNALFDSTFEQGEVDAEFERASLVLERTFRNPRYSATPIEPRGSVALPDGDGVRIWSSTQIPHRLAAIVSELLCLPRERVNVGAMDVGGGFGQKAHAYPEEIVVAWLAHTLGRPIKWIEDRNENLLAASHARQQVVRVRVAADADGRLLAIESDVVCDTGAYGVYPHGHMLEALGTPAMIPGPYRLRSYRARTRSVVTNKAPEGAYRGVGLPVATFVHERIMDLLASELDIDRADVRRRNFVAAEEMPYTTAGHQRYDSGDYRLALDRALAAIGYAEFGAEQRRARARGRLLGLGIASYVEYTGMGSAVFHGRGMVGIAGLDSAWMRLDEHGRVTVSTTLPAIGQGVATTFAQLAAGALGIDVGQVRVARADTGAGDGDGTGVFASRSAIAGGGAIGVAAERLRTKLIAAAAERLEAASVDLELGPDGVRVRGSPSRGLTLAELAALGTFASDGVFDPPSTAYPYATHACVVEVDRDTGGVLVLRYVVAEDCGTIINPLIVEGQTHGAIAQGIGGGLYESLHYDDAGQLVTASLLDYLVPTAAELPGVEVEHLQIPAPGSPNGAKGVGEGGTLAPAPAIANAVGDALGVELNELPLTPERVRAAADGGDTRELRGAADRGNTRAGPGPSPDDAGHNGR